MKRNKFFVQTARRAAGVLAQAALAAVLTFGLVLAGCDLGGGGNNGGDDDPTVTDVSVDGPSIVLKGGTAEFSAVVSGDNSPSQNVTWSVEYCDEGTTISTSGVLSVDPGESTTYLIVKATSQLDNTKYGTKNVSVKGSSTAVITNVTISGSLTVGSTLTATAQDGPSYTANIVTDATFQWKSADSYFGSYTNIASATNPTYTLVAGDQGKYIKVEADNAATTIAVTSEYAYGPVLAAGSTPKSITITGASAMNGKTVYVYVRAGIEDTIAGGWTGYTFENGTLTVPLKAPPTGDSAWAGSGEYYLLVQYSNGGDYDNYWYTNDTTYRVLYNISDANSSIPWSKFALNPVEVATEYRGTYDDYASPGPSDFARLVVTATTATAKDGGGSTLYVYDGVYTVPGGNVSGFMSGTWCYVYRQGDKVGIGLRVSPATFIGLGETGANDLISEAEDSNGLSFSPAPNLSGIDDEVPDFVGSKL
ncbi:hypothetical protein FACS189485_14820 [Spirochaetia bacterium]|nr:hypothetical protein FACS189485_14820 [Spirochaetia bacterium]